MIIRSQPPDPFYYTIIFIGNHHKDQVRVQFSPCMHKPIYGSMRECSANDYMVSDEKLFISLIVLLTGEHPDNVACEQLELIYFDYLESKYPTYSYT